LKSWKNLLFAGIALLGIFLMAEMIARIVCWARFSKYHTSFVIQGDSRWISHPFLVWANRPKYFDIDNQTQFNEYGMRVAAGEVTMPVKQPDDFWVFLLGGSAMAGAGSNPNGEWIKMTGVSPHDMAHAIDGYLEAFLQKQLPEKRVRVFNAAVVWSSIVQSRLMYEILRPLHPDWIISMDGMNEPTVLSEGASTYQDLMSRWKTHPVNTFPFLYGRLLMRNSALCFLVGEYFFFRSGIIRNTKNTRQDEATIRLWLQQTENLNPVDSNKTELPDPEAQRRAEEEFLRHLWSFHQILSQDQQKHLLLIQPHLTLKAPDKFTRIEHALVNYYRSVFPEYPHSFIKAIYDRVHLDFDANPHIITMDAVHHWDEWIFVDYCHFTREANRKIAQEIGHYIVSEGNYIPFK